MADLTHVPHTPKIDLRGLVDEPDAEEVSLASDVLAKAFDSTEGWTIPPHAHLPTKGTGFDSGDGHNGPAVDDPTTIYIVLPLSGSDDGVVYRTSINDLVQDLLGDIYADDEIETFGIKALAADLRTLADKIDLATMVLPAPSFGRFYHETPARKPLTPSAGR